MNEAQFRALLEQQFHGSINTMQAWAKKTVNRVRDKLPVNPDEVKAARAVLEHLDARGMA